MSKALVFIAAVLFTTVTVSQDLLECVDPDIRHGLFAQRTFDSSSVVTQSLPPAFANLEIPGGLELIAGAVADSHSAVAFRTGLEPTAARDAAIASLSRAGWESEQTLLQVGPFVLADRPVQAILCNESDRVLVRIADRNDTVYVTLTQLEVRRNAPCNIDSRESINSQMQMAMRLEQYMPTLTFPEGARDADSDSTTGLGSRGHIGGQSVGDEEMTRISGIAIEASPTDLADYLNGQMTDQGWLIDSSWSGELSAGSVWLLRPDADTRLTGMLDLTALSESTYRVGFRIISLN